MSNACHLNLKNYTLLFLNDIFLKFWNLFYFFTLGQAQARDGEQQYSDQNVGERHTERDIKTVRVAEGE